MTNEIVYKTILDELRDIEDDIRCFANRQAFGYKKGKLENIALDLAGAREKFRKLSEEKEMGYE